jgi:hypothetical protein
MRRSNHDFVERLRQEQQAEAEANRLAIEDLERRLGYRDPPVAVTAASDARPGMSLRMAHVAFLMVLLLAERMIVAVHPVTSLSIAFLFAGIDVIAAGILLRSSTHDAR